MAFPMIQYKATNIGLQEVWQDFVEQKFKTLEKYIGDETDVKCAVEFEKVATHRAGAVYRFETNLTLKGRLFRAEATRESFEMAIDEVKAELDRELVRSIEKKETMIKRGGRKIKNMLRFGS